MVAVTSHKRAMDKESVKIGNIKDYASLLTYADVTEDEISRAQRLVVEERLLIEKESQPTKEEDFKRKFFKIAPYLKWANVCSLISLDCDFYAYSHEYSKVDTELFFYLLLTETQGIIVLEEQPGYFYLYPFMYVLINDEKMVLWYSEDVGINPETNNKEGIIEIANEMKDLEEVHLKKIENWHDMREIEESDIHELRTDLLDDDYYLDKTMLDVCTKLARRRDTGIATFYE